MIEFNYNNYNIKVICPQHEYLFRHMKKHKTFFEEHYLRFLRSIINSKSVVVDVGAFLGTHTIYFSKILNAKKVISIEPTKRSYEILCDNIKLNDLENVETHRVAVGSSKGIGRCCIGKASNSGTNKWGILIKEKGGEGEVPAVLLTDVVKEKIDLIKIDVETSEIEVLKGASDIIKQYKPYIMVEVSKINLNRFEKMLEELNYVYVATEIFTRNPMKKANTFLIKAVNEYDN